MGEDELIQTYVDQNRILAKRNAIYSTKITELENRLNQSNLENTRLRNTLLSLVTSIESNVMNNFNNVLQLIQQSRITNGLPRNVQLDCLVQLIRPETSTPLNSTTSTPAFDIEEKVVKETKTNNYGVPQYFKKKLPEEKKESLENFSTILEQLESDDLVTIASNSTTTTTTNNEDKTTWDLPPVSSESKLPLESTFNEKSSVLQEDLGDVNTKLKEYPSSSSSSSSGSQINSDEPISTLKQKSKTAKESKEKGKKSANKPTKKSTSLVKTEEKPDPETVVSEPPASTRASSEELPPRRPSRNRKEVNYKPLSMRAKMRRESIKMLDAVGDNVLINYTTNSKKRANESQQESKDQEEPQNKRKALSNITNTAKTTNKKRQSLDGFDQADLSIFDFQEDKTSQRNRRYTTIG